MIVLFDKSHLQIFQSLKYNKSSAKTQSEKLEKNHVNCIINLIKKEIANTKGHKLGTNTL